MEQIKLKVHTKTWFFSFVFFFIATSVFIYYKPGVKDLQMLLLIAFTVSVICIGAIISIFYFSQKEVVLTETEIKKIGFSSKSIAYKDIQKIRVGSGGFSIYDKGKSPINITSMYYNFDEAKDLINQKIKEHGGFEITGLKFFIKKYIDQE